MRHARGIRVASRVYLAGPLFCQARQDWFRAAMARIRAETGLEVVWPFELFAPGEIESFDREAPRLVMERCRDAILGCSLVAALLDGSQVDDGTAWEVGFAHARGIPVVGIRTDARRCGDVPGSVVNAMIHASCLDIVPGLDGLVDFLRHFRFDRQAPQG